MGILIESGEGTRSTNTLKYFFHQRRTPK